MDMNHREVLITRSAKAGQTYHIELQSYTGTLHAEFSLIAEMWEVDPEINSLYWDLQVPLRAFSRLDEESRSRMDLTRVINDTVNLLDLREPYSEAYYASIREASAYIQRCTGRDKLDSKMELYIRLYCMGTACLSAEWIQGDTKATLEELAEVWENSVPLPMRPYMLRDETI